MYGLCNSQLGIINYPFLENNIELHYLLCLLCDSKMYTVFDMDASHVQFIHIIPSNEWPSGLDSLRQVTEVKLDRVRSNSG